VSGVKKKACGLFGSRIGLAGLAAGLAVCAVLVSALLLGTSRITPGQLESRIRKGDLADGSLILLDLRTLADHAAGHIEGSLPVEPGASDIAVPYFRALGPGHDFVLYGDPDETRLYRKLLGDDGLRSRILSGGFERWKSSGKPVATGNPVAPDAQ
jgi:rhodanese-related sulfurtransferase